MKWFNKYFSTIIGVGLCSTFFLIAGITDLLGSEPSIAVSGNFKAGFGNSLTVSQIESAGLQDVLINDPFEKSERSYSGVLLNRFVEHFGKEGTTKAIFKAIDDYEVVYERSEWKNSRILVVTRMSGGHIDFVDKGPLRIIYPDYDSEKHDSKEIMPRWIWMIQSVHLE